jgi:hypothetical protein
MSTLSRRLATMKALVHSCSAISTHPGAYSTICSEFDDTAKARDSSPEARRLLLQVLHSTRALDTALKVFVRFHSITVRKPSLGGYLHALTTHSLAHLRQLPQTRRDDFQNTIVRPRNKYLHEAGTNPSNHHEILSLLSEMQVCLIEVLNL